MCPILPIVSSGAVSGFDYAQKTVSVKLEDGTDVTLDAAQVCRQHPNPPGAVQPAITLCQKCHGAGVKDSYFAFIGVLSRPNLPVIFALLYSFCNC